MGKDSELFKAAQSGNNAVLERAFASFLKKNSTAGSGGGGGGGHSFGSARGKTHPNIQDDQGYTLLHHATLQSHRDTVNLLLRCGASTTISDNSGSCPLHLAAWKGDLDIVKMLVTQGPSRANVNQQNDAEDSALHLASQYGFSEVVEFLLQRHADPLLLNCKSESALDLAAQYGHIDTVHLLISHCPEMLFIQRAQFSPLHLAARNGHTVVALSLINAGISVNTVCDSGSALHEAAVCGKDETVELLLDKGVNLDLNDGRGRTVLDILNEYTAEKAVKIKTMIQDHKSSGRVSVSPPPPSIRHQNIVAVAGTNCLPVVEESSALAFKRGDTIVVLERKGDALFTGTCHGKTGSFLAEDVTFYCEHNGELVKTDVTSLTSDPFIRADENSPDGAMKMAISTNDPYEDIPAFPTPNSPERVATTTTGTPTSNESTSPSPSATESIDESNSSAPYVSLVPDPNAVAGRSRIDKKRLSKKDKKFQLSKDTGAYAELSPINPMEAKKEFGNTLKLNPVGPAFGVLAEEGQVVTTHNATPPPPSQDEPQFQGSYYVLEVGNFDRSSRVQVSPPVEAPTDPLQPGYYMLDIHNFSKTEQPLRSESRTDSPQQYENITNFTRADENASPQPTVDSVPQKPTSTDTHRESARPMYENILLFSEELPPPVPKKVRSKTAPETTKTVSNDEKRSSLRHRKMVYEPINIGKKSTNSSSNSSPTNCTSPVPEPESDQASTKSDSASLKRISTSSDPFAGLVMSASTVGSSPPTDGEKFRNRTETVWDNERVEMEWSQIDTLLRDISVPQQPGSPPPVTQTLASWLLLYDLEACQGALQTNGYDSLLFLSGNILVMDDLEDIGITSPDDQFNLMAAVSLLPPPHHLDHVTSVAQWLELLELSHLEVKFSDYSLERLSGFWEVELAAVIGIEELGYRKRLQYGISELRSAHPEWRSSQTQTLPTSGSVPPTTTTTHTTLPLSVKSEVVCSPSLAQAVGEGIRTARLSPVVWKHSHEALTSGCIQYKVKYLGSVIIKQLHGNQSAEEACLRLKNTTESTLKKPEIILAISWKGVKFVDGQSKMVVSTHAIKDISCCSPDLEDRRIFAYITKDKQTGKHYSHVFMADTQETAEDVRMTIAQAFEICYQKVMKARSKVTTTYKSITKNNHTNSVLAES